MDKRAALTVLLCIGLVVTVCLQPGGREVFGAIADGEALILPHMFSVANGDSVVILQNLSPAPQDINVEFFAQDGSFFDLVTATLPGMGEAQVSTPGGPAGQFQGSVLMFGNAPFTGRGQWNFDIGGNPVAVGVPAVLMSQASNTFQIPIGTVGPNSLVGVAIENPGGAMIDCTVTYRDAAGQVVAEELFSIASFGQVSQFAGGIAAGFEGSGTVVCGGAAAVVAVIQELINGFPTTLFAVPAS